MDLPAFGCIYQLRATTTTSMMWGRFNLVAGRCCYQNTHPLSSNKEPVMAAGQDDDDAKRTIMVSSPQPKSENLASSGVNGDSHSMDSSVTRRSEPSSFNAPAATSSENIGKLVIMCNVLRFVRKSIAEKVPFPHLWNDVLVMWCVIANLLDPLFCYILVVDQDRNCIGFDKKLRLTVVVLRSVVDFVYVLLVVCQFGFGDTASSDKNDRGFCSIARRYLLSSFAVDILAVLPLPQVVVLVVFQATRGSHFTIAIKALKFILICQFFPRVFRVYSFLKKIRWSSGIFSNSAGAKAVFNLFLYMLASHVFGAFWYLFTIERKAACLQLRCDSHPYCPQNYNNISSIERFCMDGCSGKASSSGITAFDFGIFGDAFNSGIVYSTDFMWKFSYCFWWGLQNLSSLGQGLKTSGHIWEIYFAVSLTVSGLVLFALLIGNLQTILQAKSARLEEMRLKGNDIKLWTNYQKLPRDLKERIKQHEKNKWLKTRGIDIAEVLHNLPKELRRQTTRHLCHDAIRSVPMFRFASEKFMDAICGCLNPVLHIAHNFIISEGELLEEVIFITKGKLRVHSKLGNWMGKSLKEGDYFGEDLLNQVFKDPHLSTVVCTKTVSTRTEVEAFVLSAKDLNNVINKYWWRLNQALHEDPTYKERRLDPKYEEPWAAWAALVVQTRWRGNIEKRKKGKLQLSSATESGNSQPSVAKNVHVFGFIHRVMKALNEKQKKKRRKRCKDIPGPSNNV